MTALWDLKEFTGLTKVKLKAQIVWWETGTKTWIQTDYFHKSDSPSENYSLKALRGRGAHRSDWPAVCDGL